MKKLIKCIFPEPIKKILRQIENFFLRIGYGFTRPIILKDIIGNRFVLYPEKILSIRNIVNHGPYIKEFSAMKKLIRPGQMVFDIGANIGTISVFFANTVSKSGRVFSFEPFPETFRRLEETIAINNIHNVECIEAAVSKKTGYANFFYDPSQHNSQFNSLGQVCTAGHALNDKISVRTLSVDDFCAQRKLNRIDFLKIDVEGFELDVLEGASRLISEKRIDAIQFEVSDVPLKSIGRKASDIIAFLSDKEYLVYEFDEINQKFTGPISTIEKLYGNYYASYRDISNI